jgi:hypothetical protein
MAQDLPDRLKGAKSLPDGKVMLKDGTIMSRSAWMSRRSIFAPDLVQITTGRTTARKAAQTRAERGMAKRAARDIKKGNKTDAFTNPEKMKKKDDTPAKNAARKAAAERAKLVPPSQRTPAQTRAIKTESRVRNEKEWRKMAADAKRAAKEIKTAATGPKTKTKPKQKQKPRIFVGRGGGMRGGIAGSLDSQIK